MAIIRRASPVASDPPSQLFTSSPLSTRNSSDMEASCTEAEREQRF
jgi:hypothetical protein